MVEVKSGYGLDLETELRDAARRARPGRSARSCVVTSFLGAHAVPAEYKDRPDAYIDDVCIPTLARGPCVRDWWMPSTGFVKALLFPQNRLPVFLMLPASLGLPVKLHAEQLSNLGGATLAASYGALSADHVEYWKSAV